VKLEIDTNSLSALDIQLLAVLAEHKWPEAPKPLVQPAPAKIETPTPKDKGKAADATAPVAEAKATAEATVTPEPSETAEDAPTMADAVAAATKLVSTGGAAQVKEALATVGAKRVSEIPPENIAAFLAALR
jgi:hypothetical protein